MIEAVIFDMDGLLVNTEPFWVEAEILGFREIGIDLSFDDCKKTMGFRIDEVVQFWFERKPWNSYSVEEVESKILYHLQKMIEEKGEAMAGVDYILDFFTSKGLKIGLASSSHFDIIYQVVDKLEIRNSFDVLHSAQQEEYGKPHPAVYLNAASKMGVNPLKTLAFEDSFYGLLSAKSARMKTVAIPDALSWHKTCFDIADAKLKSLSEFDDRVLTKILIN